MVLPSCQTLLLDRQGGRLTVTLNRPEVRNAMNWEMVSELLAVWDALEGLDEVRAVVLRGAGGHFSAGGDVKGMSALHQDPSSDAAQRLLKGNRAFGTLLTRVNRSPQVVVAVAEGSIMGGGLGLVCVSDVALALEEARFGTPEVTLGLVPAQIAPFVAQRIGLTQARQLMVTGARIDAGTAQRLGLIHAVYPDTAALEEGLAGVVGRIERCGPKAVAATKGLLHVVGLVEHETLLDEAADVFAQAVQSDEAREGMTAFLEKRPPAWARSDGASKKE